MRETIGNIVESSLSLLKSFHYEAIIQVEAQLFQYRAFHPVFIRRCAILQRSSVQVQRRAHK